MSEGGTKNLMKKTFNIILPLHSPSAIQVCKLLYLYYFLVNLSNHHGDTWKNQSGSVSI